MQQPRRASYKKGYVKKVCTPIKVVYIKLGSLPKRSGRFGRSASAVGLLQPLVSALFALVFCEINGAVQGIGRHTGGGLMLSWATSFSLGQDVLFPAADVRI